MAAHEVKKLALRVKVIELLRGLSQREAWRQEAVSSWRRLISVN